MPAIFKNGVGYMYRTDTSDTVTAAEVVYTDTDTIGATNVQDALDKKITNNTLFNVDKNLNSIGIGVAASNSNNIDCDLGLTIKDNIFTVSDSGIDVESSKLVVNSSRVSMNGFIHTLKNSTNTSNSGIIIDHDYTHDSLPTDTDSYRGVFFSTQNAKSISSATRLGAVGSRFRTSGASRTYLQAYNYVDGALKTGTISVEVDTSGNITTATTTPAAGDNSTKIATTAFVNNYLPLSGGSMTGRLYTSNGDVVIGSKAYADTTLGDLLESLRYSSGRMGSFCLSTAYGTIPTGWYNYIYVPHREGGANGSATGDNCDYGTLIMSGMNNSNQAWIVRYSSGSIVEYYKLCNYNRTVSAPNGSEITLATQTPTDTGWVSWTATAPANGWYYMYMSGSSASGQTRSNYIIIGNVMARSTQYGNGRDTGCGPLWAFKGQTITYASVYASTVYLRYVPSY